MTAATDNAICFEAKKIASRESAKDGYVITLSVSLVDAPNELLRVPVGQRMVVAATPIGDFEQPAPVDPEGVQLLKAAAAMCREHRFQDWMFESGHASEPREPACADGLRKLLGVESRSELKTDPTVQARFKRIRGEYQDALRELRA